jgi:UDP-glucose 4-epimerase
VTFRFLVLGGGGFLGGQLSRWLVGRGHWVRAFDLRFPEGSPAQEGRLERRVGSFLDPAALAAALQDVDVVLHFVSMTVPSSSIDNVPLELEANVAATVRLLDLMVKHGVRQIGFPSSGGTIYGDSEHPHPETEEPRPTCPYGLGKHLIEQILRYYGQRKGVQSQVWRIANPYGDASHRHVAQGVIDASLYRVHRGEPIVVWGDGTARRDYLYLDDVVEAIGSLLEQGAWGETVNVGSGAGASILEVLEVLARVAGGPLRFDRVPGYTGPLCAVLDTSKLRRLTGWKPRFGLEAGIRESWRRIRPG